MSAQVPLQIKAALSFLPRDEPTTNIGTMKEEQKGFHYMRIIIVPLVKEANQPLQPPPDRQNQGDGQTQTCNLTKFWSSINSRALN